MSRCLSCLSLLLAALWLLPAAADDLDDIERLHKAGQTEEALRRADALIAAEPRAAPVRFAKGVMLSDLNRRDAAIAVFVALTEDYPELPDPYNNLAVLYAAQGRFDAALTALRTALRNDPRHQAARENLGDIHLALAIEAWSTAEAASKEDTSALRRKLRLARQILQVPSGTERVPG
jgi:Flp pilus assembly protein TadD